MLRIGRNSATESLTHHKRLQNRVARYSAFERQSLVSHWGVALSKVDSHYTQSSNR